MKVLLVDDDQLDRQLVIRSLKKSEISAHVTEAKTVEEGLQLYSADQYDVVLLDYSMPKRNGLDMIIEIRNDTQSYNTAIIMISSAENEALAIDCLKAGAQDFLLKSDITATHLRRALMHAAVRFELEQQLLGSYQQVKSLAESDALTGLANRYHFDKNLKATINNNHRKNTKVALVLFDLDHFKNINDNFGHDIGDLLLKRVVTRITSCLRGGEHFSRLDGDEFAITLSNINNPTQASSVARRIITVLQKPFDIENNVITTGASIGISLFPDNGLTSETLFKYADIAMYRAKRKGRGQACFFEDEMQRQFLLRIEIETSLRTVVSNNQLILHYQSVINLSNNEVEGFEALIRWQDKGSLRMPDEFIKIAEETHLIIEIGEWVINEALSTLAKWNETQTIPFRMAINVSPVQLCEVRLVNYIQYCLSTYNIPAHLIDIEITETALFKVESQAKQVIQSIHNLGCKLLLDDFGTGYSSISHLSNFPISGLKIDKNIIPESEYDVKNIKLTHCLSAMAKTMGLSVIAEGIDSEFKATTCKKFSIDMVQGYLYSKPKSKQDIEKEHLNPDN